MSKRKPLRKMRDLIEIVGGPLLESAKLEKKSVYEKALKQLEYWKTPRLERKKAVKLKRKSKRNKKLL